MTDEWTVLLITYDQMEAEILKDVLESGDIPVELRSAKVISSRGKGGITTDSQPVGPEYSVSTPSPPEEGQSELTRASFTTGLIL